MRCQIGQSVKHVEEVGEKKLLLSSGVVSWMREAVGKKCCPGSSGPDGIKRGCVRILDCDFEGRRRKRKFRFIGKSKSNCEVDENK